ncbi:MAG: hypothetical protein QMD95_03685 [Candidatus Hodarchaeaceae archaeon]|nr:hypothetical protein [Candidatus Hodarchaeaceae archaeon]
MVRQRIPGHVITIAVLGLILVIAAMVVIFWTASGGGSLELGAALLVTGVILAVIGGRLARKYVKLGG